MMVNRWYRFQKKTLILLTICIIYITYYISLNDNLPREPDLNITRRNARFTVSSNASSSVVVIDITIKPEINRNSVVEYIEYKIEEALKEDKGSGCKIPQLDPFAREMMLFDYYVPPISCKEKDWVKCYLSECRVVDEILSTMLVIVCNYQDIIHVSDHKYYLGESTEVMDNKPYILNVSDHVKIKCTGTYRKSILNTTWIGYALGFRKSVPRIHSPSNREDTLNVLLFGFDSTSKNGFIRKMPKSYQYLKNHAKSTILNGYNIVGDGTPAALFPILTGKTELEMPDVRKTPNNNGTMDSLPFIFYKLTKDGYRTAYFEDQPWMGTFQCRYNGFRHQPVDHYLRSFYVEESRNRKKWHKARSRFCVGDTPQFQLMMNVTDQFMRLDGKRFCLSFVSDITHEGNMVSIADDPMLNLLRTLEQRNVFEDTLLIVFGDHGPRFAKIRNILQGKLEERLPFMSIRLPEKFKRMRPNAQAQLEANANILTTPHDIHATILDVLDWPEHMNPVKVTGADLPRAMTLLEPIPKNRSCSEAGIQPHWCSCVKWINVTDITMVYKTADAFVNYINELTESQRSKCVSRTLTEIQWVMKQTPNSELLSFIVNKDVDHYLGRFGAKPKISKETYQIRVVVGPGHGIYEASMTYLNNQDKFLINTRDISRTNAYGNEPSCISATLPHLNQYCYCNDYVPQTV